jgi:aspartyl-tRNA(Asn)/glutamyl-tRNA(Gln) amidotransferase subunit B
MGLAKSSSTSQLDIWCQQVIEEMPEEAQKVKAGKKAVVMRLVGKVMSNSKGAADPVEARNWFEKQLQ